MYNFMEIQMHNDPIKLTVSRSSMGMLAFFGAIGGMNRFIGSIFKIGGGYFSGKFFAAKMMSDMYMEKVKKKGKKDTS